MASDREDIADGLLASVNMATPASKSPLAARKSSRSRSKSIGPQSNLTVPIKFEDATNRRKSAIIPGMRSILSAQDDEAEAKKRKEARRKSLANRRVSFAPEATLHTWDVIEYMRDANSTTSSSTSSSNNSLNSSTRRSPSKSPQSTSVPETAAALGQEPPSTPPEQTEAELEVITSSPVNQRGAHQKKHRRSSSGNPSAEQDATGDVYTSSPMSGSSSPAVLSDDGSNSDASSDAEADDTETGMSMDISEADLTARSIASQGSTTDSTGSSARLDEALRQAARQAGTQGNEYDETGEVSMEMAGDEVTNAFVPFVQQRQGQGTAAASDYDKENVDPFNHSKTAGIVDRLGRAAAIPDAVDDDDDEMSMDVTRAVGGILSHNNDSELNQVLDERTMDFTMVMPGSGILNSANTAEPNNKRTSLKRRRSSLAQTTSTDETGSPAKKPATGRRHSLRASRRKSSMLPAEDEAGGDATMELTVDLGTIKEEVSQQLLQEQWRSDVQRASPQKELSEGNAKHPSDGDTSFGEEPMDMTMVVGGGITKTARDARISFGGNKDEDLSMEFTTALGAIVPPMSAPKNDVPTPATGPVRDAQTQQWKFPSPKEKALVNSVSTPQQDSKDGSIDQIKTPSKSPKKRTPRKSLNLATPDAQTGLNSEKQASRPSPARSSPVKHDSAKPVASVPNLATSNSSGTTHAQSPTVVAETPIKAVQLFKPYSTTRTSHLSPSPKRTPIQALPPPVRSPLAPKSDMASNKAPVQKLSDSIKQLATPRKQMNASPLKKVMAASTPKTVQKSPKKSASPVKTRSHRQSGGPKKRVRVAEEDKENADIVHMDQSPLDEEEELRVPLQDFLNMTGIQFMDLRTTKRRHTGFPGAKGAAMIDYDDDDDDAAGGDGLESLERTVVAATVTVPNIEMFKHSCQEMNTYISSGRDLVQDMDEEVLTDPPPLFKEYLQAPPKERQIMDDQFRAMKAYARLQSKGSWYQWRSQLLNDLSRGLNQAKVNMESDDVLLQDLEQITSLTLDTVRAQKAEYTVDAETLRRGKIERESGKREELEEARGILQELNASLQEKKEMVASLRRQLQEQSEAAETLQERKEESLGAIKEANRIREECRGWSSEEVTSALSDMRQSEDKHNWSVRDATSSPSTITLAYNSEIELFFNPCAFADACSDATSPAKAEHANQPISLNYTAVDKVTGKLREVGTVQRFFLQLLRAQLLALPQPKTSISSLLKLVGQGWNTCSALVECVRHLESASMTDVAILGDEVIGVKAAVVLPDVATKVMVRFAVTTVVEDTTATSKVQSNVKVAYGERYDDAKMTDFLKGVVGEALPTERMTLWAEAVGDLRARLIKRGRKS